MMNEKNNTPGYLLSVFQYKCPRCRQGNIFKEKNTYKLGSFMQMNETCPVCGQPTEIEPGFYYGTAYVSYALTVAFSIATFVAWFVLIGFSLQEGDYRVLYWGIMNALFMIALQPVFMRLSRSMWFSWFVKYNPNWKLNPPKKEENERIVPGQMNNW
jgi:uncharacterized protein (DUF983 family)